MPPSSPSLRPLSARATFRRAGRAASVIGAGCLLSALSCSHDSHLVVTLISGDTPFVDVAIVEVEVQNAGMSTTLIYDRSRDPEPSTPITTSMPKTFSVAFTPSRSGDVTVRVFARSQAGACVGEGSTTTVIQKGDISRTTVALFHSTACGSHDGGPPPPQDGGVTFPGCNPAAHGLMCPVAQTCFVNCSTQRGMCVTAGNRGPGEACTSNNDCMPGTQCFDYGGIPGCAAGTKVCLRFCASDAQCAAGQGAGGAAPGGASMDGGGAGGMGSSSGGMTGASAADAGASVDAASPDGGGGQGGGAGGASGIAAATPRTAAGANSLGPSACQNAVVCDLTTTTYKTCTFACDPRGEGTLGCPAGLLCFLYKNPIPGKPDSPDCNCREPPPNRMGTDGAPCTSSVSCAPGHICNQTGGTLTCRRLCKMSSPGDCTAPQGCSRLENNDTFGVCVGA